jgi:hypothetical protein
MKLDIYFLFPLLMLSCIGLMASNTKIKPRKGFTENFTRTPYDRDIEDIIFRQDRAMNDWRKQVSTPSNGTRTLQRCPSSGKKTSI